MNLRYKGPPLCAESLIYKGPSPSAWGSSKRGLLFVQGFSWSLFFKTRVEGLFNKGHPLCTDGLLYKGLLSEQWTSLYGVSSTKGLLSTRTSSLCR